MSFIKNIINYLLSLIDLRIVRASTYRQRLNAQVEVIGCKGAAKVFARYIRKGELKELSNVRDFINFYIEHYSQSRSQWSQDVFVSYATNLLRGGTYLEIGGADGVTHSNTLMLRDFLGWSGVLVEPDPNMFATLMTTRGNTDQVINAAIAPKGGTGKAILRKTGQLSALVGYEGQDVHHQARIDSKGTVTVGTIDITDLIMNMPHIDYFSLDVEGAEVDIIKSINWSIIKPPSILTIEHNSRPDDISELRTILDEKGYEEPFVDQTWLTRGDLWMVHTSSPLKGKPVTS